MMIFCWASSSLVLRRHGWSILFYPHPAGALDRLRSLLERVLGGKNGGGKLPLLVCRYDLSELDLFNV